MISVFEWAQNGSRLQLPFLVLGKGPSFALVHKVDQEKYSLLSLNHAVRELKVDIAHVIDIDVIEDCADCLDENAKFLLMPRFPHVDSQPTVIKLEEFVQTLPILRKFSEENRLLYYQLWSGPALENSPLIQGTFSGAVVVDLLSQLGVKTVHSLGVDGGARYSVAFADLSNRTMFRNGLESYEKQFAEIEQVVTRSGMEYKPLAETIRVFVGCNESEMLAARVLEYSIRKNTRHPVQVFYMKDMPVPRPKERKNQPGTGFTFNRFLVPKMAGYDGRAIWIDSDMVVKGDIGELWNLPMQGKKVLCSTQAEIPRGWEDGRNNPHGKDRGWEPGRQLSVMLMDCSQLDWDVEQIVTDLDAGAYTYKDLMTRLCIVPESDIGDNIPGEWNCLEWFEEAESRLVHFTVVPTQPWKNDKNRLVSMWEEEFLDAVRNGAISRDFVAAQVAQGYVKSSLLELLDSGALQRSVNEPQSFPEPAKAGDEAEALRHMLWDSMIQANRAKERIKHIESYPLYLLEQYLIRKPFWFGFEVLKKLRRAIIYRHAK